MREMIQPAQTDVRNYGIDGLRIVSMLFVLTLHILGLSLILFYAKPFSAAYFVEWTMEIAAYCAINCFGLISGYVGVRSRFRYTNLVLLWLQVALYNVVLTAAFYVVMPGSVSRKQLLLAFFPVYQKHFWYFSAYFGMYFLLPLMNRAVLALNRIQAKVLCVSIVVVFSLLFPLMRMDPFALGYGFTLFWLVLLYLLGACIREFDFMAAIRPWKLLMGYLLCVLLTLGWKIMIAANVVPILGKYFSEGFLISYTSPTILVSGICLLMVFARWKKIPAWMVNVIKVASSVTFGVYILHLQENVFQLLFKSGGFTPFVKLPAPLIAVAVLLSAVAIFAILGVVDLLRAWVFRKLKLKQRLLRLEEKWIGNLWD